jgi:hypothetical protein
MKSFFASLVAVVAFLTTSVVAQQAEWAQCGVRFLVESQLLYQCLMLCW